MHKCKNHTADFSWFLLRRAALGLGRLWTQCRKFATEGRSCGLRACACRTKGRKSGFFLTGDGTFSTAMSEELQAAMQLHASPLPIVRQQSPEPPKHGRGEGLEAIRPPSGGRSRLVPGVPGGGVPGGGTHLPTGDQPGDPWATLVVVLADGLMGERPPPRAASSQPSIPAGRGRLPPPVAAGIASAVELSGAVARSLVVCGGGGGASGGLIAAAMMSEVARVTPGGIDAFGPGRRIEALLKETSAEFGNLWVGAPSRAAGSALPPSDDLLLAGGGALLEGAREAAARSHPLRRSGRHHLAAARASHGPRVRVRPLIDQRGALHGGLTAPDWSLGRHVFTDWRVLVSGGQVCRPGRPGGARGAL